MKKSVWIIVILTALTVGACKDQKSSDSILEQGATATMAKRDVKGFSELTFKEEGFYDFGTIKEGEVVEHEFSFTNTGKQPLKIVQAKPSCGCTAPDWTKSEIAPGEKGAVTVRFDSKGRLDQQNKSVRLITNTKKGDETVRFTAFVEK